MKKYSIGQRLRYAFDKEMSKGTISMIRMLFFVSVLVVIVAAVILYFCSDDTEGGFWPAIWISLMHVIDAGTITGQNRGFVFMLLMTIVTLCGVFVTSVLIGIINTAIESKLGSLKKGKSKVLEKNHIIILGYKSDVFIIISELIAANKNREKGVIVVMDDNIDADKMKEEIDKYIPDQNSTEIICRNGNCADTADISICSPETCRSVIINTNDDFTTVKSILAVTDILKENKNNAYITAVVNNEQSYKAAKNAGEEKVEVIYFNDIVARIVAHVTRYAGLSRVFTEIFNFNGSEIYIEKHSGLSNVKFGDVNRYFAQSTIIGLLRNDDVLLNPKADFVINGDDKFILLAEDDGVAKTLMAPASVDESHFVSGKL